MTTVSDLNDNMDLFFSKNKSELDLVVYYCGMQNCRPNQKWGPVISDHYLIHYITEGCGTFHTKGKTYILHKNEGFLISPNIAASYSADKYNPWKYSWIGFNGLKAASYLKACNLSGDNPIFISESGFIKDCFGNMNSAFTLKKASEVRLTGLIYLFFSELIEQNSDHAPMMESSQDIYLRKSMEYIEKNYFENITIENIASHLSINRNYFSAIFKDKFNITPKEYVTEYRMEKACELLKDMNLSIKEISFSVGYSDSLNFSKVFKKVKGCSPKKYRTSFIETEL